MVKKISFGRNPRLLIHSGTHGDEWEVIGLVEEAIEKYKSKLPPFIFIPEVSPSAVKSRTRNNARGKDMNRVFSSDSTDPEVIENLKHLKGQHFDLMVSFHEDPESSEYYVYDQDKYSGENEDILRHNGRLEGYGIKLFSGIDDPDDPALGYEIRHGYRKFKHEDGEEDGGMITVWALNNGIAQRCLTPEIPGKLNLDDKKFIVESFFEEVLLIAH